MTTKLKKYWTIQDEINAGPCEKYAENDYALVRQLFGKRKRLTVLEICELDIPVADIFWTIFREELIPANVLHGLACDFAEIALMAERKAGREPDKRSWKVIRVNRQRMKGKATNDQLAAARAAASAAASAAADAAAYAAADAAYAAASAAAYAAQLKRVVHVITSMRRKEA